MFASQCCDAGRVAGWRLRPWWRPWRGTFHERHWVARILATSFEMRFQPPPTNASNSAGDGLLYLPGLSLATPQYSCGIKWQAIYNTSVKVDCTSQPAPPSFLDLNVWLFPNVLLSYSDETCSFFLLLPLAPSSFCLPPPTDPQWENNQSHFPAWCCFTLNE